MTFGARIGTLTDMPTTLRRLDPERRRRRLQLLAELSQAKTLRERLQPHRARAMRLRELLANRRRLST